MDTFGKDTPDSIYVVFLIPTDSMIVCGYYRVLAGRVDRKSVFYHDHLYEGDGGECDKDDEYVGEDDHFFGTRSAVPLVHIANKPRLLFNGTTSS